MNLRFERERERETLKILTLHVEVEVNWNYIFNNLIPNDIHVYQYFNCCWLDEFEVMYSKYDIKREYT